MAVQAVYILLYYTCTRNMFVANIDSGRASTKKRGGEKEEE